ncbi:MAG: class I SAM-dependent methyltransferase [Candidatus Saccharibacteria bacterium]
MIKINDYDNFAAKRQEGLVNGTIFSHRFVEKPAMKKLLRNLSGNKVLMLGCGTGDESKLLEEFGASDMHGVDLSSESIMLAKGAYPKHEFLVGDMHHLQFDDEFFDFIYSSLTVHYSADPLSVYKEIFRVLKPGGSFQFSVGHPVRWASESIEIDGLGMKILGFSGNYDEKPRLYGNYSEFKKYDQVFPSGEVLSFWVGSPSMHYNLLKAAGFIVKEFIETKAVEECKDVAPFYYERFSRFPQFMIFVAEKPKI